MAAYPSEQKLVASDGQLFDIFGCAVAIDGETIVVGARDSSGAPGMAYVFERERGVWIEHQKLAPVKPPDLGRAGASVAIDGDTIVIGAPEDKRLGSLTGAAYVYRFDPRSGLWVLEQKLVASDGSALDGFGAAVGVSGDTIAVSAPTVTSIGSRVHVFRFDPEASEWREVQKLQPADLRPGDYFGASIAMQGERIAVGAMNRTRSGAVYVYRTDSGAGLWTEEQKLSPMLGDYQDDFGAALGLEDDVLVVGSPEALGEASVKSVGTAHLYRYEAVAGEWREEQRLVASNARYHDRFGIGVGLSRDLLVVGAWWSDAAGDLSGSAYLYRYERATSTWHEEREIIASDTAAGDHFGVSAALRDGVAVFGAQGGNGRVVDSGAAYAFLVELHVAVDVRPHSRRNIIRLSSNGRTHVALLGDERYDPADVDIPSLAFGPGGAKPVSEPRLRDVNGDGVPDLVLNFAISEAGIAIGDTEACLTGRTFEGVLLSGCDAIQVVFGCGRGFAIALVVPLATVVINRRRRFREVGEVRG